MDSSLQEIGERHGTDKATVHSYLPIYEEILGCLREKPITLLEIGVASGASLGMWLEWMPLARVHGIDINLPALKHERLTLHQMRQENEARLREFPVGSFDVVVDDGSHDPWQQLVTCHGLWESLKPGGCYFVEDVQYSERIAYWTMMPGFRVWTPHKAGRWDDIIVMLRKPT